MTEFVVWQAKITEEEQEHITDDMLKEMYDKLENFWGDLKDELLYA